MSNFIQISNTKLEELKTKIDALPSSINSNDAAYHSHGGKVSAEHLSDLNDAIVNNIKGDIDSINTTLASGVAIKGDDGGTPVAIAADGNGILKTQVVNAVNVMPHSESNSGITDDPRDSVAVGLRARTTITDATTETFLLTDDDGRQQVRAFQKDKVIGSETIAGLASQSAEGQSITLTGYSALSIAGNTSNTSDPVILQAKAAGVWYEYHEEYPKSSGAFYFDVYPATFTNYRIKQTDTLAANFTINYGFGRS